MNKMTEKQPDWIDKARNYYLYDSDGETPSKETIYADSINPNIIESKKAFRDGIQKHIPQESTYESGYQKGKQEVENKIRELLPVEGFECEPEENFLSGKEMVVNLKIKLESLLSPTDTK